MIATVIFILVPTLSGHVEETTMSYITPQSTYPEDISSLDYDALVDICGSA